MQKPTVSLVLGGGHSIGVPLAVSAKASFIAPSATMTIHPVRMNGLVLGVPQTLSYFDKMQERIVRFVEENSKISPKKFRELMMKTGELVMDVGTVLDGSEAVKCGLIDNLGGLGDAVSCLYGLIEKEKRRKDREQKQGQSKTKNKAAGGKAQPKVASPRALAQLEKKSTPKKPGRPKKQPPAATADDKKPHTSSPGWHTMEREGR